MHIHTNKGASVMIPQYLVKELCDEIRNNGASPEAIERALLRAARYGDNLARQEYRRELLRLFELGFDSFKE